MTWAFFDLYGTLLDPGELDAPLERAVRFGWASTLAGGYQPFDVFARWAVGSPVGDRLVNLAARDGARAALETVRAGVLSDTRTETGRMALENAGLLDRVELVLGSDQTEAYRPDRRPYDHAVVQTGAGAGGVWMVSARWWDVLGGGRAGLRTAFVGDRSDLPGFVPSPDLVAPDLQAMAAALGAPVSDSDT